MQSGGRRNVIGAQVKRLRKAAGFKQDLLVARLGRVGFDLGQATLSQIETGSRSVSDLEMILIAKALRVDVGELVPDELPAWVKDVRPPTATRDGEF